MSYVIFGATGGIGTACVENLVASGKHVVAVARNADKLMRLPDCVDKLCADFEQDQSMVIAEIVQKYGQINGMVYAAGIDKMQLLHLLRVEELERFLRIHAVTPLRLIGQISKRGNYASGCSIVAFSSIATIEGGVGHVAYTAAKGALEGSLKSVAADLARIGIRYNLILPGIVHTDMSRGWMKNLSEEQVRNVQSKYRFGEIAPADIAQSVAFLLSSESRKITGQKIVIDSGAML